MADDPQFRADALLVEQQRYNVARTKQDHATETVLFVARTVVFLGVAALMGAVVVFAWRFSNRRVGCSRGSTSVMIGLMENMPLAIIYAT